MIPMNKNPNFSVALKDATNGKGSETEVGVLAIIIKNTFSITSKIPVKKGVIVIKHPIVSILLFDLRNTMVIKPKANET